MDFRKIYDNKELSALDLERIIEAHSKVEFKKGEYLLEEGKIAREYYCLESGLIRAYAIDSGGDEITTAFYVQNQIVIESASFFLRKPTRENIHTLTDCVCRKIDFESFQMLYHSINAFSEWGRSWMTRELITSKQRLLSVITESAANRYMMLQNDHPEIVLYAPLKYIASYLGITDTSLSRIRKEVVTR